jgi:glycosyl transferase family 25
VLFDLFDRIEIIHLPARVDRLNALRTELLRLGSSIDCEKVKIPPAPTPTSANGFSSRGVYGNFLSHLDILKRAHSDGLSNVLILEDDAIFSTKCLSQADKIANALGQSHWDEFYIGHSITKGLPQSETGIVVLQGDFFWAHCYAVHQRVLGRLISFLEKTLEKPAGKGGKMYIDAAHNEFRKANPDVVCLVTSPRLSVQKGSPSGLNARHWYDDNSFLHAVASGARAFRDELWRRGLIEVGPDGEVLNRVELALPWPQS